MTEPRLYAFVDEAGDSGGKYEKGSSQFLAMGGAVLAQADTKTALDLFSEARIERGHAKTFRKFSENNDKDNFVLTKLFAKKPVRLGGVDKIY